jgi:hypothetical protein
MKTYGLILDFQKYFKIGKMHLQDIFSLELFNAKVPLIQCKSIKLSNIPQAF